MLTERSVYKGINSNKTLAISVSLYPFHQFPPMLSNESALVVDQQVGMGSRENKCMAEKDKEPNMSSFPFPGF